ncbi:MAG TPA: SIMPL domain-containing protein [Thermomicrobiales bacterium]|nr:SIMPL domain-containing protein [Thermomicrobiales bacterium]
MRTRPWRFTAVLIALVTLSMSLLVSPMASAQATPDSTDDYPSTINVNGRGTVTIAPDTAQVELGVMANSESLEEAQLTVSDGLAAVTDALLDAGVLQEDISTSSYNVYPVAEYDRDGNYIGVSRYEVSSGLNVVVRDIESVGTILDTAVDAGANNVWGISFYVEDPSEAAAQARTLAVDDARAKADQLATASGSVITRVLSITETSSPSSAPVEYYDRAGSGGLGEAEADMAASVPVSPGQAEIVVTVQVIYEIEPANG